MTTVTTMKREAYKYQDLHKLLAPDELPRLLEQMRTATTPAADSTGSREKPSVASLPFLNLRVIFGPAHGDKTLFLSLLDLKNWITSTRKSKKVEQVAEETLQVVAETGLT
jgi:hypothetical protein